MTSPKVKSQVKQPSTGMPGTSMPGTSQAIEAPAAILDVTRQREAEELHNKIVSWTKQQFMSIRNARTMTERQWYMNLAFYNGKQHVAFLKPMVNAAGVGLSTKLWVPPAPYYRSRPVINRIRPTIRTELAQLTNNKPTAQVIPASAEDRDMYAANAGEQIWDSYYREKKIKSVIRKALWWTLTCGTGYIKSYWDAGEGPKDPVTQRPLGDVCYSDVTPFHVFCPDLREEELENQPFLIHAQVKSPEFVQMKFSNTAVDGTTLNPKSDQATSILDESFLNLMNTQAINKQENVLVLEVWVKPGVHPMFPEGAFYTMVGDKIVQGWQGLPYSHGKYPFAKFDHIPAGKFYSTSSIEDLIPLQKEYNRTRGQIIEAKNRMAKPQLVAARGSIDASKITTEPGQVIFYVPGFQPPQPLPLTPLPSYVIEEVDRILMDWNDISGQHEISKGQVPPGVTAATAISFLQERDESKLSPTFDSLEEGIEKIAQMTLSYVSDYWDTERIIRIAGPDGSFDALAFKGSDLRGNQDIKIEAGSSLPTSKAAKQALIMDMMKMGFVQPQDGMEVMDMGGINKIYEKIQVDRRQVQRENLRMSKVTAEDMQQHEMMQQQEMVNNPQHMPTILMPVNTWDNHKIHIEYHNQYRKSQSFENLPLETKTLFEQHVQMHVEAMAAEMMTMNPKVALGIPPDIALGDEQSGQEGGVQPPEEPGSMPGNGNPGPDPMPPMEGMPQ